MAKLIPDTWVSTSAYTVGTNVYYNGSVYENVTAVSANANGNDIPVGNSSWKFSYLVRIEDYYSLQDAIEVAMNVDDDTVNNSIPLFIQAAERGINKVLRSPAQKVTRVFEVDSDSKFEIPGDTLEVIHMRQNSSDSGYSLSARGSIVIEAAVDKQMYHQVLNQQNNSVLSYQDINVDYPVYWNDDEHFYIAPKYTNGTEIEYTYYQNVPALGTYVLRVNDNYDALNEDDETLAEWVADGNAAADFVQAEDLVTKNLWTVSIPHLLRLGALVAAESYLRDHPQMQVWKQEYVQNLAETVQEFAGFDSHRQFAQTMTSGYFS